MSQRNFSHFLAASLASTLLLGVSTGKAVAENAPQGKAEFAQYAQKMRESALLKIEKLEPRPQAQVQVPTTGVNRTGALGYGSSSHNSYAPRSTGGRYPWKSNIVTTVFWVGEKATARNPVANHASSWDAKWALSFGGYDDPDVKNRRGFLPATFVPKQNPFYVALPYNDVTKGTTKPEARFVIPWFNRTFERQGKSVCRDRWIAIRKGNRICYAQWSDCGPFSTDHWQYVFGNERPRANINSGAGLDVSPAVRDYLGMNAGKDVCDWKFVEFHEVPQGPWGRYGNNNHFVMGVQPERQATNTVPGRPTVRIAR